MITLKWTACLGCALAAAFHLLAPPPARGEDLWGEPTVAERKIEKALDEPTEFDFVETPLEDVVLYLKNQHQIEIQIDRRALRMVDLDPGTPITKELEGISLRSALRHMLRELDLGFAITDEVLLITTPEEAHHRLYPRVYPVGHLIAGADDPEAAQRDFALLCELIKSTANPTCWNEVGGPGSIDGIPPRVPNAAVVVQDRATHEEVEQILALLDRATKVKPGEGPIALWNIDPGEGKIRQALQSSTELDFVEASLEDVVDYLSHRHDIEIVIDRRALEDVGLPTDTPITRNLKGISLRSALRLMLRELDLTYYIQDGLLLITTPESGCSRMVTVLYPIEDLLPADCKTPQQRTEYGQKLAEMVAAIIQPQTWEDVGGPGSAAPFCTTTLDLLVVSHAPDVHPEVAGLLARPELRQRGNEKTPNHGKK